MWIVSYQDTLPNPYQYKRQYLQSRKDKGVSQDGEYLEHSVWYVWEHSYVLQQIHKHNSQPCPNQEVLPTPAAQSPTSHSPSIPSPNYQSPIPPTPTAGQAQIPPSPHTHQLQTSTTSSQPTSIQVHRPIIRSQHGIYKPNPKYSLDQAHNTTVTRSNISKCF